MSLKAYTRILTVLVLLTFAAFLLVINYIDPDTWGQQGKVIFYASLGLFLGSFFSLFLLFIRKKTLGEEAARDNAGLSIRQGILLALLAVGLLIFQSFRILVWWDGLLLVAGIFLLELYFLSRN